MKIHYTIYGENIHKGEDTCPACNDNKRMNISYLTRDINDVTCKRCIKSIISSHNFALEMHKSRNLFDADHIDRLYKENRILEKKLKR